MKFARSGSVSNTNLRIDVLESVLLGMLLVILAYALGRGGF